VVLSFRFISLHVEDEELLSRLRSKTYNLHPQIIDAYIQVHMSLLVPVLFEYNSQRNLDLRTKIP
jgi:hypothetical protein